MRDFRFALPEHRDPTLAQPDARKGQRLRREGNEAFFSLTADLDGFSRKVENHAAAVALHYMHYNFARIHKTLRITPAMAAGISDHVWSVDEIVGLLDTTSAVAA